MEKNGPPLLVNDRPMLLVGIEGNVPHQLRLHPLTLGNHLVGTLGEQTAGVAFRSENEHATHDHQRQCKEKADYRQNNAADKSQCKGKRQQKYAQGAGGKFFG